MSSADFTTSINQLLNLPVKAPLIKQQILTATVTVTGRDWTMKWFSIFQPTGPRNGNGISMKDYDIISRSIKVLKCPEEKLGIHLLYTAPPNVASRPLCALFRFVMQKPENASEQRISKSIKFILCPLFDWLAASFRFNQTGRSGCGFTEAIPAQELLPLISNDQFNIVTYVSIYEDESGLMWSTTNPTYASRLLS
jgi:hypothetical protein